jgi:hypothetical protein
MRGVVDSRSVPTGSPVGQNEPPVAIGSHAQPSEPIGDKNRIISMALKRAVYAGVGKEGRSGKEYGREVLCLGSMPTTSLLFLPFITTAV